jgi:hypothetical protein
VRVRVRARARVCVCVEHSTIKQRGKCQIQTCAGRDNANDVILSL